MHSEPDLAPRIGDDDEDEEEYDPTRPNDYAQRERARTEERLEMLRKKALARQLEESEKLRQALAAQNKERLLNEGGLPLPPNSNSGVGRGRQMLVPSWVTQQRLGANHPP